jgi:hypothetical protein
MNIYSRATKVNLSHPEAIRPGWLRDLCDNFTRKSHSQEALRLVHFAHLIYLYTGEIH